MRWKNFKIWRGHLPHWRADGVVYFATFRHRRPLNDGERLTLFRGLFRPDGRNWDLLALCVLSDKTELLVRVREGKEGAPYELSDVLEKVKTKSGKAIIKKSGERFPPFYTESFDRIVRDEAEYEQMLDDILAQAEAESGEEEEWETLWIAAVETPEAFGGSESSY